MPITGQSISIPSTTQEAALAIINGFLNFALGDLQCLQVNGEIGIPGDTSRNIIQFEYCPMIEFKNLRPRFQINREDTFLEEGVDYTLSLANSQLTLLGSSGSRFESTAGVLPVGDEIEGFYRFSYFSNDELQSYLINGLNALNARKPATAFLLDGAPLEWNDALTHYALMQAYRRILTDTTLWSKSIIFTDPTAVRDQIQSNLNTSQQYWDFASKVSQRRGWASPKSVATRRLATQQRVTAFNWQSFAIGVG